MVENPAIGNHIAVRLKCFYLVFPEDFIRLEIGKRCQKRNINILKEFVVSSKSSDNARKAIARCENYCARNNICWGCSIDCGKQCRWNAIPDCGKQEKWTGLANGDITQRPGTNIYPGYSYFIYIIYFIHTSMILLIALISLHGNKKYDWGFEQPSNRMDLWAVLYFYSL